MVALSASTGWQNLYLRNHLVQTADCACLWIVLAQDGLLAPLSVLRVMQRCWFSVRLPCGSVCGKHVQNLWKLFYKTFDFLDYLLARLSR